MRFILVSITFWTLWACNTAEVLPEPTSDFVKSTQARSINWAQFRDISLPFDIIYGGPAGPVDQILKKGFSQICIGSGEIYALPASQTAMIYYNVAQTSGTPAWQNFRNPLANNYALAQSDWTNMYAGLANTQAITQGQKTPKARYFVFDIERQVKSLDSIKLLQNHFSTPEPFKAFSATEFTKAYHQNLQVAYSEAVKSLSASGVLRGSYGDAPILNTFANITGNTWQKWTTDPGLLNPNFVNHETNQFGGQFEPQLEVVCPSAYYYYPPSNPLGKQNLAYLLFQIEANKAWTQKPIIPFVWLRYSTGNWAAPPSYAGSFIDDKLIEATAIFPFMAGAKGLWLWEDPTRAHQNESWAAYEVFMAQLQRLAAYKEFFESPEAYVSGDNPVTLIEKELPVWRGIVKNGKMLVAAANPYAASETTETTIKISYKTWTKKIKIKGQGTYLAAFDLTL